MVPQFQQGNSEDVWNVLIWCSVPIPFDDCETILCDYSDYIFPSRNQVRNGSPTRINFWYFLFWYYGLYNALALFLITKLFSIYALNWYPKRLGAKVTFALFWLVSQSIGVVFYYIPMVHNQSIFWVCLTFLTMAMPLVNALLIIHRKRMDRRHRGAIGVLLADENNVPTADPKPSIRWIPTELPKLRAPASYRRFLWFCTALAVALVALIGGEMYAYFFLATLPHTPLEAFFYVYSWVAAIYIMDAITDYILYRKIRQHIQALLFHDLFHLLSKFVCQTSIGGSICHCSVGLVPMEKIGRSFYLRNLAENTTMLGFLCWVNILHFGPNRAAYPYFHMDDQDGSPYNHNLTVIAALVIWTSELTSAFITRLTFKRAFDFSITQQAISEFERYPEMIIGFVLVMVHVLQNILLALIKLDFSTGLEK
ncbi:uncharacterized protein EV154DRAFT_429401 [Mucor mucedo]|uniref:uncharacterized protein n=1 Tax=Mucor mucedo TaxID=29922 RepID=UPI00221EB44B|nr:uncharacterized protein EV154DRAFT_429401 [Mucor mucedo]KAI7877894.1 hypothetical protein EV154DRAFT_429401 [Mucor mucedo]